MNASFFLLEESRQKEILNAGYSVFAEHSYRKANMMDIAWKAGISKSLLFYYFRNKKEFYLYLWNQAAETTYASIKKTGAYERNSLLEMMQAGLQAKITLMRDQPDMAKFALRAFMEQDPEVRDAVQASYHSWFNHQAAAAVEKAGARKLRPDLHLNEVLEQMRLIGEGYVWRMQMMNNIDLDQLTRDISQMMTFWKTAYEEKDNDEESE